MRGLTTAASMWAVSAIGLAVGYGRPTLVIAILGTLLVLISLSLFRYFERYMNRPHNCYVSFSIAEPYKQIDHIREQLLSHGISVSSLEINEGEDGEGKVSFEGHVLKSDDLDRAIGAIAHASAIRNVRWEYQ